MEEYPSMTRDQLSWFIRAMGAGIIFGACLSAWLPFVVINFFGMIVMLYGQARLQWTTTTNTAGKSG